MQLLRKVGDEIIIIYNPRKENVEVGENLKIYDENVGRGIVAQVIEQSLVDLTGILEDIVRHESMESFSVEERSPLDVIRYMTDVKNMKMARAKILKELTSTDGRLSISPWTGWIPDRNVSIEPLDDDELMKLLNLKGRHPMELGLTVYSRKPMYIDAFHLQGINIITGKKGSGKSHMGKILLLGLISHGARAIVFDINDEYSKLGFMAEGLDKKSEYYEKIVPLNPGENLYFTLEYIGLDVMYDVMTTVMGLREASAYTFRNIWSEIEKEGILTIDSLKDRADEERVQIAEAITRRLDQIEATNIIVDREGKTLEKLLERISSGGALIINLKAKDPVTIAITVQTILSKLRELLESGEKPLWIFAEEAHFYLSETAWDDIITRMRHLGAYQVYLTNTPTAIPQNVIRQADNIFLFHLSTQSDLNYVAPASKLDAQTIVPIAISLPPHRCMVVGSATNDYPIIIDTKPLHVRTAGETRLFFEEV